jgi:hypothetical protein
MVKADYTDLTGFPIAEKPQPRWNREFREFVRMEFGSSKSRWLKPKPYSRNSRNTRLKKVPFWNVLPDCSTD